MVLLAPAFEMVSWFIRNDDEHFPEDRYWKRPKLYI